MTDKIASFRIDSEKWQAFIEKAKDNGDTASGVLKDFIDRYIQEDGDVYTDNSVVNTNNDTVSTDTNQPVSTGTEDVLTNDSPFSLQFRLRTIETRIDRNGEWIERIDNRIDQSIDQATRAINKQIDNLTQFDINNGLRLDGIDKRINELDKMCQSMGAEICDTQAMINMTIPESVQARLSRLEEVFASLITRVEGLEKKLLEAVIPPKPAINISEGISAKELAQILGVNPTQIGRWASGKTSPSNPDIAEEFAKWEKRKGKWFKSYP